MLSKDKKKCNLLPYNKVQMDENSQALKFDLKEKILRTLSEVQNKSSSDIFREKEVAYDKQDYFDTEFIDGTLSSRSFNTRKKSCTKIKTCNALFLIAIRFFLIIVTLSLFGYNLLSNHNEFIPSNY